MRPTPLQEAQSLDDALIALGKIEWFGTGDTRQADRATHALRRLVDAYEALLLEAQHRSSGATA